MDQGQGYAVLSLLGGLFLFAAVLFLAWYCTKWIGKRYGTPSAGSHIKILERTALGPDRHLMIVQLEDRVWLLGVTPQHIDKIGELDPEIFSQNESAQPGNAIREASVGKFSDMLGQITKKASKKICEKGKHDE